MMHSIKYCQFAKLPMIIRHFTKTATASNRLIFENLSSHRQLIRLAGNEVFQFLQGLITNDINHLTDANADSAIYTMFLNKPGRVLCDAIIYKRNNDTNACLIECDQAVVNDLKRHLMLYRVRKKIDIETINNELNIWVGFVDDRNAANNAETQTTELPKPSAAHSNDVIISLDPRLNQIGTRFVVPSDFQISNFQSIYKSNECVRSTDDYDYTEHRYVHGVSEGSNEMPPLKMFPFEANCDFLHGISFHKGCYLGQEFTARTYHTGVIRKRIMPLVIESPADVNQTNFPQDASIRNESDQLIGKLKGIRNKHAIGSLKVDQALDATSLTIGEHTVSTHRPHWWPRKL